MRRKFLPVLVASLLLPALSPAAGTTVREAPPFTINMLDGSKIEPSQYPGKVVVMAMILTTCPHCQASVRSLAALQKEFGRQGLQVLAVALDQTPQKSVPAFIASFNPPFPVGYSSVLNAEMFMHFDTSKRYYVPYITFIGRDGRIHGQYKGDDAFNEESAQAGNFRTTIKALLAERTAARK